MADLREWWATATPRARDAKVAEALGWRVVAAGGPWWWERPDGSVLDQEDLPGFTEPWTHAGPLLDTLGTDTDWEMTRRPDRVVTVRIRIYKDGTVTEFAARCDTAPEAICLAFCLAKGVPSG